MHYSSHMSTTPTSFDIDYLRARVRSVPDWPEPGVMFRDITPLVQEARSLRILTDAFVHRYMDAGIKYVAGIDARGFIIGAIVAHEINAGFVPIRKKGKLPYKTLQEDYVLEYGSATVEIHVDACAPGDRVLLVDDLIATGGTMLAAAKLLQRLGAQIVDCTAIVDLPDLGGSARLREQGFTVNALLDFPGH
jgi:adenine phosphoribosyltransferase